MVFQLLANGLVNGAVYAILALGFALVYNTTHIFHVAYATLYMIPPYFVYTFYTVLGWSLPVSILLAILFTMIISVLIELVVYRPLLHKRSSLNVLLISSLGVMIILINTIALFYGNETKVIAQGISDSVQFGGILLTYSQLYQLGFCIVIIMAFFGFLKFSTFGIETRAMRDDKDLTRFFGLNVNKLRIKLFVISAFLASAAGILNAYDVGMDPYVGLPMLLNAVVALIIGGIGKFHAPVIGGVILGLLHALVVWQFSANWQPALTFGVLILFLLFRPQGLFGEKPRLV